MGIARKMRLTKVLVAGVLLGFIGGIMLRFYLRSTTRSYVAVTGEMGLMEFLASLAPDLLAHSYSVNDVQPSNEDVYSNRRKTLTATCRRLGYPDYTSLSGGQIPKDVVVERTHSILYCPITKVGSTFWIRTLSVMAGQGNLSSPFQIKLREASELVSYGIFARNLTQSRIEEFLKHARSFLFIRDPYTRLFSAYMNKLYNAQWSFWQNIGLPAVRSTRTRAGSSVSYGDDVTFSELIKFILMLADNGRYIDVHFRPMHQLCNPCSMSFDFVGKLETFKDDAEYLLTQWKRRFKDIPVTFDDFEKETIMDLAKGYVRIMFETYAILKNKDENYPLYNMLLRTWTDLQIRGRLSKSIPMPLSETTSLQMTQGGFLKLVSQALDDPANGDRKKVALQQEEALVEAYRSISADDMEKLARYVARDCELFGYDNRPSLLFDRSGKISNDSQFRYFI